MVPPRQAPCHSPDTRIGSQRIETYAPPKINLTLAILGRRPDGYHDLASLVAFVTGCGDTIEFLPGGPPVIKVDGPYAGDITGPNILDQTLDLLRSSEPRLQLGTVYLRKEIPVASGVGGGSTNAAALLRAIIAANGDVADTIDWPRIAARLGADVPVCLMAKASFMTGIGERIRPLPTFPQVACVLANPGIDVPADKTARVFRQLNASPLPDVPATTPTVPDFRTAEQVIQYVHDHQNDLAPAAERVFPAIANVGAALAATSGARVVRLSGAGPTCFALYDTKDAADTAAADLATRHPSWWVRATTLF